MQIVAMARIGEDSGLVRGDNVVGYENLSDEAHQEIKIRFGDTPALTYLTGFVSATSGTGETPVCIVDQDDDGIFATLRVSGAPRAFNFALLSST